MVPSCVSPLLVLCLFITIPYQADVPPYCNVFDGRHMNNTIIIEKNARISNVKVPDPLIISFDFILNKTITESCSTKTETYRNEGKCCQEPNKVCNLMQFGISTAYDDPGLQYRNFRPVPLSGGLSLPSISVIFKNGSWVWQIKTFYENKTTNITATHKNTDHPVLIEKQSSFYISFSNTTTEIYIDSQLYYNSSANHAWQNSIGESHPFYISNQDNDQLLGTVTNLCIVTDSISPTKAPTSQPSQPPTQYPTLLPTPKGPTHSPTLYQKIDCYTEKGNAGDLTIACSQSGYIITSCGIEFEDALSNDSRIFNKGSYIKRKLPNELWTDGICHVNYNLNTTTISNKPVPQARCCNFQQQYKQNFTCRYFESGLPTNIKNEYSYATCDDQFELLLSCGARVDEKTSIEKFATSQDEIQYYGTFFSNMDRSNNQYQYNSKNNYYFKLKNGKNIEIPLAPPPTPRPTQAKNGPSPTGATMPPTIPTTSPSNQPTNAPTITTTAPTNYPTTKRTPAPNTPIPTTIQQERLNHINIQCVAQHGNGHWSLQYSVTAIATCCTQKYNAHDTKYMEPTSKPTAAPTFRKRLYTHYFGPNGTTTKTLSTVADERDFFENEDLEKEEMLAGISEWSIYQVQDNREYVDTINDQPKTYKWKISYQGILIGKYLAWNKNGTKQEKTASGDYGDDLNDGTRIFEEIRKCSSFELDTINGVRDYINGFDVYNTTMTVIGITFYTAFGRKYSCPDNEIFDDDTKEYLNYKASKNIYKPLNYTYYESTNTSMRKVFEANSGYGIYKLNGWRGTYQPKQLQAGVIRKLYASIGFSFMLDDTVNTLSPTNKPSTSPTKNPTKPTPVSTLPGQQNSEILKCYSRFGNGSIACETPAEHTMTGCNGYSVEGQVFSTIIDDSKCIVSTINGKDAVAIGTCCYFKAPIKIDFSVFKWTSVAVGSIFVIIFVVMSFVLFFKIKNRHFFNPEDVDDDTLIDRAVEAVGEDIAEDKVKKFQVSKNDLKEMQEEQKEIQASMSIGLQM